LALTHLAKSGKTMSELRAGYPEYYMAKQKIELVPGLDVDGILAAIAERYSNEELSTIDGVKITWSDRWVHLRKSNTEPIVVFIRRRLLSMKRPGWDKISWISSRPSHKTSINTF
jgi:phosphomannomutase